MTVNHSFDLSMVPDLEGRQRVAKALADFDAVGDRRDAATAALWKTKHRLEAAISMIERKIERIERTFDAEFETIEGFPDLDSPYQMHSDHLGCYCCELSGLPLRDDDETVEWGDGEALACIAAQAPQPADEATAP